jgi:hypothetical protein
MSRLRTARSFEAIHLLDFPRCTVIATVQTILLSHSSGRGFARLGPSPDGRPVSLSHFPRTLLCIPIFALLFPIDPAHADPIRSFGTDVTLVGSGSEVTLEFAGSDAAFDSALFLSAPMERGPFFPNHATLIGAIANLGAFRAETELSFRLHVFTTGDEFFTGPGSRNPDGFAHAQVSVWGGSPSIPLTGLRVGFEDLFGGGDLDFNDYEFVVSGVRVAAGAPVPEPGTMFMVSMGVASVAARMRKQRQE